MKLLYITALALFLVGCNKKPSSSPGWITTHWTNESDFNIVITNTTNYVWHNMYRTNK